MPPPPLPPLPSSWESRVFAGKASHETPDNHDTGAPSDPERLAFIGDTIIHLAITTWLHDRYPKHRSSTLMAKLAALWSEKPAEWAKLYKLRSRIIVTATTGETKNQTLSKGDLFRAYVAAVYINGGGAHGGSAITSEWMKQILEYEEDQGSGESDSEESSDENDVEKHLTAEGDEINEMRDTLLVPLSQEPVQKTISQPPPASINTQAPSSCNALSTLNEKAVQRRIQLTWDDSSSGPDHAKTWTTKLTVENSEFSGTGHNKKLARSAAAEVALNTLKWVSGVGTTPKK